MDPLDALAILLVLGAVLLLTRDRFAPGGLVDSVGAAFLPYRPDDGWPHGVQEAEPRPWATSRRPSGAATAATDDEVAPTSVEPEIIEAALVADITETLERVSVQRVARTR